MLEFHLDLPRREGQEKGKKANRKKRKIVDEVVSWCRETAVKRIGN